MTRGLPVYVLQKLNNSLEHKFTDKSISGAVMNCVRDKTTKMRPIDRTALTITGRQLWRAKPLHYLR